jgi:prophage maintenance system killer protein
MATTLEDRAMEYLSVYDIVWINTTLAGRALEFNYVTLEEAMAAQYSYGVSTNVPLQAANLLQVLVSKRPFSFGNVRTGFVAVTAFLTANGYALKVDDSAAAGIVRDVAEGRATAEAAIEQLAAPTESKLPVGMTLRALVTQIINGRSEALRQLTPGDE